MPFNPAYFLGPAPDPVANMQLRQRSMEGIGNAVQNSFAARENRRRYDQEYEANRDDEMRRREEFDANLDIHERQLGLAENADKRAQQQEERAQQTHALNENRTLMNDINNAASLAHGDALVFNQLMKGLSLQWGGRLQATPSNKSNAVGTNLTAPPPPEYIAPTDTANEAAQRINDTVETDNQTYVPAGMQQTVDRFQTAGMQQSVDSNPYDDATPDNLGVADVPAIPPLSDNAREMYGEMGKLRGNGMSRSEMKDAVHAVRDEYVPPSDPKQALDEASEALSNYKPAPLQISEAQQIEQENIQDSFENRKQQLAGLGLNPMQMAAATVLAAHAHGINMQIQMPMPPPGAPPEASNPISMLPPEAVQMASAPPQVDQNYALGMSMGGALDFHLDGKYIGTYDGNAVQQRLEQNLLQKAEVVASMAENEQEANQIRAGVKLYIQTGDPQYMALLQKIIGLKSARAYAMAKIGAIADPNETSAGAKRTFDMGMKAQTELNKWTEHSQRDLTKKYAIDKFTASEEAIDNALELINSNKPMSERMAASQAVVGIYGKAASNHEYQRLMVGGLSGELSNLKAWLTDESTFGKVQVNQLRDTLIAMRQNLASYRTKVAGEVHKALSVNPKIRKSAQMAGYDDDMLKKWHDDAASEVMGGTLLDTDDASELTPDDLDEILGGQ